MKKHLFIAASLLTLFAASCSNEDNEVVAGKAITLNATISNGPDTRMTYDETSSKLNFSWSTEEKFNLYQGTSSPAAVFTKTESGNTFTGTAPTGGTGTYYAVYGNNITNTDGVLTVDISSQTGTIAENGITHFMVAETDDLTKTLAFNRKLAVLKLNLEFPAGVSEKIEKVTLMGLHNKATYTLAEGGKYTYAAADMGDITATNGDAGFTIDSDKKITAYVAVFPEEVKAYQMVIYANAGDNKYMYTLKSAKTLTAGKVIPVNVSMNYNYEGYECVDLGLSVKWATMNVGAEKPTDYGDYYAWGETETKSNYSRDTYMCSYGNCGTSNDPLKDYVYPNNKSIAGTKYDVAHVKWGGTWKMPTREQLKELYNTSNCSLKWTTDYKEDGTYIKGWIFTSKKTGYTSNSIFLPAAGYRDGSSPYLEGSYGVYWSATPDSNYAGSAYDLLFHSDGIGWDYYGRFYGLSVRPVSE